jgi:hypothetical protein
VCWECDHPESSHHDCLDHLQGLIVRFGWAVVGVVPRPGASVMAEGGPLMPVLGLRTATRTGVA